MTVPNKFEEIRTQLIFVPDFPHSSEASFKSESILLMAIPFAGFKGSQNGKELKKIDWNTLLNNIIFNKLLIFKCEFELFYDNFISGFCSKQKKKYVSICLL